MKDSHTDTLILIVCVICAIPWRLTGSVEEMQQESQDKRHSAGKWVAGNYTLVYFLNMPYCWKNKIDGQFWAW